MKKISTLFKKDPSDLSRVINEVNPENQWVFEDWDRVKATRKFDGTASAIFDGQLYKRYDVKGGKTPPPFAIPCQERDEITGHWPHWVLCNHDNPADKFHFEAFNRIPVGEREDGTYELCGPKVQGNPEQLDGHVLIPHGIHDVDIPALHTIQDPFGFLQFFFSERKDGRDIEGIVFHHEDGRMCKIRLSDFGLKRVRG